MWTRYTEHARKVIFSAKDEAQNRGSGFVTAEHLSLGILNISDCLASHLLQMLGVSPYKLKLELEPLILEVQGAHAEEVILNNQGKRVINFAYDEAGQLRDGHIGTEHFLLGLIREEKSLARKLLSSKGINLEKVRSELLGLPEKERRAESTRSDQALKPNPREKTRNTGWELFVYEARKAVFHAQEVARKVGSNTVTAEHLLYGTLADPNCTARHILQKLGLNLATFKSQLEALMPKGSLTQSDYLNLTTEGKRALDFSHEERIELGEIQVSTEHLLVGIIRQSESPASKLLSKHGVKLKNVRAEIALLRQPPAAGETETQSSPD